MLNQDVKSRFWFDRNDREITGEAVAPIDWQEDSNSNSGNLFQRQWKRRRARKICKLYDTHLATRDRDLEVFSMPDSVDEKSLSSTSFENQIVHLHWIAFLADLPSFFRSIPDSSPIVWTLHDMNPLTGGCHYSTGCQQFQTGCGHCPQLIQPGSNDVSRHSFKVKQRSYRNRELNVVTPSRWLLELAKSSSIFPTSTRFHHIRLGFDLKQLVPLSKPQARAEFGFDSSKLVIGFGAESIANRRKGFDLLLQALAKLPDKSNLQCAVFGSGQIPDTQYELPEFRELGFINDPKVMTQFYSACDLVVVPSREDNQPQVGLEAMACGTPVVGFDAGGIGEYIEPGKTGWLAKPEDSSDLATQINRLTTATVDTRMAMASSCRKLMEKEFDIIAQSAKYRSLYQQLLPSSCQRVA